MKRIWKLTGEVAKKAACREILAAPDGHVVTLAEPTRNREQNALMWCLLDCMAKQTDWHGNKLNAEEWKDLLSAGLVPSIAVPNLTENGFVILGQRTSKLSKSQFAALIELIYSVGADKGVEFGEPVAPERWAA